MKSLFEEMGGTYTLGADGMYYPDLELPEEEPHYGKYGRMRLRYLKEHHKMLYNTLLLDGELVKHLNEVDDTANQRMEGMIFFLHLMLLKQRYTNTHTTNCFFSTSRLFWIPYFCRQPMILYPSIALIQRFQTGIYIWLRAMMKRYEIVLTI